MCGIPCLRENMVNHINNTHSNEATAERLLGTRFCRHICGKICTISGLKAHSGRCAIALVLEQGNQEGGGAPVVEFEPIGLNGMMQGLGLVGEGHGPEIVNHVIPENGNVGGVLGDGADGQYGMYEDAGTLELFIKLARIPEPKILKKYLSRPFQVTVERCCDIFFTAPTVMNLLRILAIPKLCLKDKPAQSRLAMRAIVEPNFVDMFAEIPIRVWAPRVREEPDVVGGLTMREKKAVQRYISRGQGRKAAAMVRGTSPLAQLTDEVKEALRLKHPAGTPRPFGDQRGIMPPGLGDNAWPVLDHLINRLSHETSAGISGWNAALVQAAYGAGIHRNSFTRFMRGMAIGMLRGEMMGRTMLCAGRLTPLEEEAGKLRPITCGELFYRIIMGFLPKVIPSLGALLLIQLGVGSPGGVEPMVELLEMQLRKEKEKLVAEAHGEVVDDGATNVICLDLSNAFNAISRVTLAEATLQFAPNLFRLTEWAYGSPTPLVLSDGSTIASTEGVRQGCPLGPLLFSMGIRFKLVQLGLICNGPRDLVSGYIDDIMILTPRQDLIPQIVALFSPPVGIENPVDGLKLNITKTKQIPMREVATGAEGIKFLGSMIGSIEARRAFITKKIDITNRQMVRLAQLPNQVGLWLLRNCFVPEHAHLLRTMDCVGIGAELLLLDGIYTRMMERFRGAAPGDVVSDTAKMIYSLPISMGGCGIHSLVETRYAARMAARDTSHAVIKGMYGEVPPFLVQMEVEPTDVVALEAAMPLLSSQRLRMKTINQRKKEVLMMTLDEGQRMVFEENATKIGGAWMRAIPYGAKDELTDREVAVGLSIRALRNDGRERPWCDQCGMAIEAGHCDTCARRGAHAMRSKRHDLLKLRIARLVSEKNRWVDVEPPVTNRIGRRADLRIGEAEGGAASDATYGLVDLKVKALFAADTAVARQAVPRGEDGSGVYKQMQISVELAAVECIAGYENTTVVPLVISAGGFLHKKFYEFLKEFEPEAVDRAGIFIDISLILLRGRARLYNLV
jgi:hypothetical protein